MTSLKRGLARTACPQLHRVCPNSPSTAAWGGDPHRGRRCGHPAASLELRRCWLSHYFSVRFPWDFPHSSEFSGGSTLGCVCHIALFLACSPVLPLMVLVIMSLAPSGLGC